MQKNVAGQSIQLFAFDITTGAAKTGDQGNITAYVCKDHGSVVALADVSAFALDSVNAAGIYLFGLAQSETNAIELTFTGKSTTANVAITPRFITTTPPNFQALLVDSGGKTSLSDASISATTFVGGVLATDADLAIAVVDQTLAGHAIAGTVGEALTNASAGGGGSSPAVIATAVWANAVRTLSAGTNIVLAKGVGVTGFNDVAVAQVKTQADTALSDIGLTAVVAGRIDTTISSRLSGALYVAPPTAIAISDQVWDEVLSTHTGVVGSTAAALGAAQSAGDPWATLFSGQYGVGTMGYRVGTFLDATVSSRLATALITLTAGAVSIDVGSKSGFRLSQVGVDDFWDDVIEGAYTGRQYMRGFAAAMFGKASGLDTTNPKYRDPSDSKDRINAVVDTSGDRTQVILDLT